MLDILETEEERKAKEMELARARFALGVGSAQAPPGSDKPPAPPDPNRTWGFDPSGPAKTEAPGDAVYGSSPAAQLFRKNTAQMAPSAPMATGFEKNPVAFNNALNRPDQPQQKPKPTQDVIAAPLPGEAPNPLAGVDVRDDPAAAHSPAPPPKKGTEDIIGPPARAQSQRQRQIEALREELGNWKTGFFDTTKFGAYRQQGYQNKLRALDQLEQAEAAEQRVKKEDRDYQLAVEKWNWEKGKPTTVGRDSVLFVPKKDGQGYDLIAPPEKPQQPKPNDPQTGVRTKDGKYVIPVYDHKAGKVIWEEAPFEVPEPKDPFAMLGAREAQKIDAENRADTRKKEAEVREDTDRRKRLLVEKSLEIDKDNKNFPTLGKKRQAKREAATLLGLPDPFNPQPDATPGKVDLGGAKKKPDPAAAPAADEAVDFEVGRDANGRMVMTGARGVR